METVLNKYANLIFNQSFLPTLILSPAEKLLACTESFCQLVGYSKAELFKKLKFDDISLRRWAKSGGELLDRVKRTGRPLQYNEVFLHKDGKSISTSTCLNLVRDSQNKLLFYYLIVAEINPDNYDMASQSSYDELQIPIQKPLSLETIVKEMQNANPQIRMRACADLVSIQETGAIPVLIKALKDSVPEVRMSACLSLSELEAKGAISELTNMVKDKSGLVRWGAVTALGRIGGDKASPTLVSALQDSDDDVKSAAREALAAITENRKYPEE